MMARLGRLFVLGIALVALFSALMVLSYSLPENLVRSHMRATVWQLEHERINTSLVGLLSLTQDDFTDSIMLNESLRKEGMGPVESAFGNYMTKIENPSGDLLALESLKLAVEETKRGGTPYARYWHGYQVVLRPLLIFFDFGALRWFNAVILTIFTLVVTALLRYRLDLGTAIAFLLSFVAVGILAVPMSMQFSGVFYVALAGMTAVIFGVTEGGGFPRDIETFLIIGAVTSYVDLLTAPVLTLGMPLAVLILKRMRTVSESALKRQGLCTIKVSCAWSVGYVGCWFAKWTISSLVLRKNIYIDAAQNVVLRLNGVEDGVPYSRIDTLLHNVARLLPLFGDVQPQGIQGDVVAAACAMPVAVGIVVVVLLVRHLRTDGGRGRVFALFPVGALPLAWYLVVNNHSRIHFSYTFRALAVTVFTLVAGLFYLFDPHYLRGLKVKLVSLLRQSPRG